MARINKYASINFNEVYGNKNPAPNSVSSPATSRPASHGGMLVLTRPSKPQPPQPKKLNPQPPSSNPLEPTAQATDPPKTKPTIPPIQPYKPEPAVQSIEPSKPEPTISDSISLRPLGRSNKYTPPSSNSSAKAEDHSTETVSEKGSDILSREIERGSLDLSGHKERENRDSLKERAKGNQIPKPEPFRPPHLRPGYVSSNEEPFVNEVHGNGHRFRDFRDFGRNNALGQGQFGDNYGRVRDVRYSPNSMDEMGGHTGNNGEERRPKSGGWDERMRPSSGGGRSSPGGPRPSSGGFRQGFGGRVAGNSDPPTGKPQFYGSYRSETQRWAAE
ncbi:hypothetical protein AMTRI_Chr01g133420 [Amborella trichopoda]|uniref:Uncharacterized protein n=1 Tax=Amborella trichopoda TaxID=13333 RepID=W1PZY3_AMBTC|nr:proteoglycan 4 [Amborella trichopoda]ERN14028.1 hypothetical protein AMTR_s00021p00200510 [Amborella trichopoda]|eukprot:XP_006852561.1 proteoglycan 4 [Amborella trichopoda]